MHCLLVDVQGCICIYMYVYICMYIYVCIYVYVCMYIYVCMYVYICMYVCICMYVYMPVDGLSSSTMEVLEKKKKVKGSCAPVAESVPEGGSSATTGAVKIVLEFRRFIFDPSKRMIQ